MIDLPEVILRLGAATLIGAAIGLNRDLHGKPIGVRTLGLVGLASAMARWRLCRMQAKVSIPPTRRAVLFRA